MTTSYHFAYEDFFADPWRPVHFQFTLDVISYRSSSSFSCRVYPLTLSSRLHRPSATYPYSTAVPPPPCSPFPVVRAFINGES